MSDCNVHHMTTGGVCRDCGTPWSAMTANQQQDAVIVATHPTPDPRERGKANDTELRIKRGEVVSSVVVTSREVVVLGSPLTNDESHNCDALGCGQAHVLGRITHPDPRKRGDMASATGEALLDRLDVTAHRVSRAIGWTEGSVRAGLAALRVPAPSEAVAWKVEERLEVGGPAYNTFWFGDDPERAARIRERAERHPHVSITPLYTHPAPARGVTEADWTAASKPLCVTGDNNEAVLQVMLDGDGDVHLKLTPTDLNVRQSLGVGVEFCTKAGGGRNMAVTKAAREFVFALNRAALTPDAEGGR